MKINKIKKVELLNEVNLLSDDKIDELKSYVDKMLYNEKVKKSGKKSLQGIWKDKGFENISDLENIIKQIRKETSNSILDKNI